MRRWICSITLGLARAPVTDQRDRKRRRRFGSRYEVS